MASTGNNVSGISSQHTIQNGLVAMYTNHVKMYIHSVIYTGSIVSNERQTSKPSINATRTLKATSYPAARLKLHCLHNRWSRNGSMSLDRERFMLKM